MIWNFLCSKRRELLHIDGLHSLWTKGDTFSHQLHDNLFIYKHRHWLFPFPFLFLQNSFWLFSSPLLLYYWWWWWWTIELWLDGFLSFARFSSSLLLLLSLFALPGVCFLNYRNQSCGMIQILSSFASASACRFIFTSTPFMLECECFAVREMPIYMWIAATIFSSRMAIEWYRKIGDMQCEF